MARRKTLREVEGAKQFERQFIMAQPERPADVSAREFIMQNPAPPPWGPAMQEAIREGLSAAGFTVTRCECLETHPIVAIRLRGPAELEIQEMRHRIRKLAKDLGHRAPPGGMAITGRAGKFDGAFVMESEFGVFQPCSEILP